MPRIARFLREDAPTIYHVISRTALDGLPFKDTDKWNPGQANNTFFVKSDEEKEVFRIQHIDLLMASTVC